MESEKIENLLALSLSATNEELVKSPLLGDGIIGVTALEEPIWEVIVKYNGDIQRFQSEEVKVEELISGYAIITLKESLINQLAVQREIEYIEKPKAIFPSDYQGNIASCVYEARSVVNRLDGPLKGQNLTGRNVLIGVIDSGIDYFSNSFRNADGTTRIAYLYDQTLGREFTRAEINEALAKNTEREARELVPSRDITGHGTAVACICGGYTSNVEESTTNGVAINSEFIIVKLNTKGQNSFPMTTNLLRGFNYAVKKAVEMNRPIAINLSFGNTYGSHDGSTLVERFVDNVSEIGKCAICIGSGNEGAASGHHDGVLDKVGQRNIEFAIAEYERSMNIQLWKNYTDIFQIKITSPLGGEVIINQNKEGSQRFVLRNDEILVYVGFPKPYSVLEEIFIDFIPQGNYITSGIWTITLIPQNIVNGYYNLYMPSALIRSNGTRFFTPNPFQTLTIPSTSKRVVTVGAYNSVYDAYADFSGRGIYESASQVPHDQKPDIVAPGVDILAVSEFGVERFTGTSFATPFVTGAAALLMEYGIVWGNDPYLYGEKLKAYLIRGAKELPSAGPTPNALSGWGMLCATNSLPQ